MRQVSFIFLLFTILFQAGSLNGQEDIMREKEDSNERKFNVYTGPSYLFYLGNTEGDGADILPIKTFSFNYGIDFQYNFARFMATGLGFYYKYDAFVLDQSESKIMPDAVLHDKQRYMLSGFSPEIFIRFYPAPDSKESLQVRPAFYANFIGARTLYVRDYALGSLDFEFSETYYKRLEYVSNFEYGLSFSAGYSFFSLKAAYRLSDIFTPEFKEDLPVEFPRLSLGLSINLNGF